MNKSLTIVLEALHKLSDCTPLLANSHINTVELLLCGGGTGRGGEQKRREPLAMGSITCKQWEMLNLTHGTCTRN